MKQYKKCKVKDCNNSAYWKDKGSRGYCNKHYQQMWKNGRILERTKYDKQDYIDCKNYYEICLYHGIKEQKEVARTKINKNDYEKVKGYRWCIGNNGYVYTRKNGGRTILLHRLIMGKRDGYDIDHINHDMLDNRRKNIRYATTSQNIHNQKCKGYYWDKKNKKWQVYITINKKYIYLGRFINEQDAINVRRKAEKKYFGEFAYQYIIN